LKPLGINFFLFQTIKKKNLRFKEKYFINKNLEKNG